MEDIIIEESNVLNDEFFMDVNEDIIDENSDLFLNYDQINTEITGLLMNKYKDLNLSRKTTLYFQQFFLQNIKKNKINTLKPIIKVSKIISYDSLKPDNHYVPDTEYDNKHFAKGEELNQFLNKYNSLNTNNNNPYIQTFKNLENLQKPFIVNETNYDVSENIDANRHSLIHKGSCMQYNTKFENYDFEIFRIIKDEKINLVGYYNQVINNKQYEIFDINKYVESTKLLKLNDNVIIWFNKLAFFDRHIITSVNASISEKTDKYIQLTLDKEIVFDDVSTKVLYYYLNRSNNPFFIYEKNNTNFQYHKEKLLTDNIVFIIGLQKSLDFIIPINIAELVFINRSILDDFTNLQQLKKMDINIDLLTNDLLLYIFRRRHHKKIKYPDIHYDNPIYVNNINILKQVNGYLYEKTYIDSCLNRFIYLKNNTNFGYKHLLNILKNDLKKTFNYLKTQKDKFNNKLEAIELESIKKTTPHTISKLYKSLIDLNNDNGKPLFYDKQYDKTFYKIKDSAPSTLKDKALKTYIMKELNNEYNQEDINFEAESIMNGNRRVRIGDFAILIQDNNECTTVPIRQVTYIRQLVQNKEMWIKSVIAPFKVCGDKIENDISNIVLDPFDNICKKIIEFKKNLDFQKKLNISKNIEIILAFIDNYENYDKSIDEELEYYNKLPDKYNRHIENPIVNRYEEDVGYSDFIGDEDVDLEKVYGESFEFGDNRLYIKKDGRLKILNEDILETLTILSDINVDDIHIKYILDSTNLRYSNTSIQDAIDNATLLNKKQKELFLNKFGKVDAAQMKKLEDLCAKKIKDAEQNANKKYYYDIILYITGMLILLLQALYPVLLVRQIYPKCIQFFSYMGHPINDNVNKSLVKYFACLLISIGSPDDLRFGNFNDSSIENVEKMLIKVIDEILELKFDLKTSVLNNAEFLKIQRKPLNNNISKYEVLNTFYKPCFTFPSTTKDEINYLKELYNAVRKSQTMRINMFNNPTIINSCCMEQLTFNINYYDFFKDIRKPKIKDFFKHNISYIPSFIENVPIDFFLTYQINFNIDNIKVLANQTIDEIKPKKISLDEEFYNNLLMNFEYVINNINKLVDDHDALAINNLRNMIIDITSYINLNNIRSYLIIFINTKLKTILSKIINQYKYTDKIAESDTFNIKFSTILEHIYNYDKYIELLPKINEIIISESLDYVMFNDDKESILLLSNKLFTFFRNYLDLDNDKNIKKQTCEIINFILKILNSYLTNNDLDSALIKSSMEELREVGKQKTMAAYAKDESQRQLQKELKRMGDQNILKIDDQYEEVVRVVIEEPKTEVDDISYEVNEYAGVDDDGDKDYDEYYVPADD